MNTNLLIIGDGLSTELFLYYFPSTLLNSYNFLIIEQKPDSNQSFGDDVPFYFNSILPGLTIKFDPVIISMGIYDHNIIYTMGSDELSIKYSKKIDDNFQEILNKIRIFRNNIDHCKFVGKRQYDECLKLLKQNIKSLDIAISVTEEEDFINKNLELQLESIDRISKMLSEVVDTYKPLMESLELITQPMTDLNKKVSIMLSSLSSAVPNIPSIVLPEIELPKFNIPNILNDIETSENDKK